MSSSQVLRVGAVQAAPVFLDREATTQRACQLIAEAGRLGVDVLGFPEGYIPTHPDWYHYLPASSRKSFGFANRLFNNSVEVPGPTVDRLADAAVRARVNVVVGVCERTAEPDVNLYNTQLFISSDGVLLGKHQKIMPTLAERVVHSRGSGAGLRVFATPAARVSGLICGENSNPLAVMTLTSERPHVHVASWPSPVSKDEGGMGDLIRSVSQWLAYASGSFVLSSQAVVDESIAEEISQTDDDRRFLVSQARRGHSMIVAPDQTILATAPDEPWEGIVTAEIDLQSCVRARHIHDFAGHYNRPDIFRLQIDRATPRLVTTSDDRDDPSGSATIGELADDEAHPTLGD